MAKPIPLAYADCIDITCPRCHSGAQVWCINPISQQPSAVACAERYRAAKGLIESESE